MINLAHLAMTMILFILGVVGKIIPREGDEPKKNRRMSYDFGGR